MPVEIIGDTTFSKYAFSHTSQQFNEMSILNIYTYLDFNLEYPGHCHCSIYHSCSYSFDNVHEL